MTLIVALFGFGICVILYYGLDFVGTKLEEIADAIEGKRRTKETGQE